VAGDQQALAHVGGQRLDRLPQGDPGGPVRPRREPRGDHLGPALGRVAQDPADGLADEELLLLQHLVGVPGEPLEVAPAAAQRPQQRQHRRPPQPEVVVAGPAVERAGELGAALGEPAHDVLGQAVHQRPRAGGAQHVLDEDGVASAEQRGPGVEQLDGRHAAFEYRPGPQCPGDGDQLAAGEPGPGPAPRPDDRAGRGHCGASELQVALQVRLLAHRTLRRAQGPELALERRGLRRSRHAASWSAGR
jgi:hypothetical protein